jgi:hypothetical protein
LTSINLIDSGRGIHNPRPEELTAAEWQWLHSRRYKRSYQLIPINADWFAVYEPGTHRPVAICTADACVEWLRRPPPEQRQPQPTVKLSATELSDLLKDLEI